MACTSKLNGTEASPNSSIRSCGSSRQMRKKPKKQRGQNYEKLHDFKEKSRNSVKKWKKNRLIIIFDHFFTFTFASVNSPIFGPGKVEKEQTHYQTALNKISQQLALNPDNPELLQKKTEIENQLIEIDKSLHDIDYREANQRAGYVYIISNIGAFGENVFKISSTRPGMSLLVAIHAFASLSQVKVMT